MLQSARSVPICARLRHEREIARLLLDNPAMASPSIADLFAARLRELEEIDRQSSARTAQTLASVRATIAELEALELPTD